LVRPTATITRKGDRIVLLREPGGADLRPDRRHFRCGGRRDPRDSACPHDGRKLADNLVDDFDIVDLLTTLSDPCVEMLDIAAAGIVLAAPDGTL
jgi:hypothetical protein